jgi:hypothetical protein
MTFESIILNMVNKEIDYEKILIIDKSITKRILKINTNLISFNFCSNRYFFYIQGLSDIKQYIPDIDENGILLLIITNESFNSNFYFDNECKYFIKNFNDLEADETSFVHEHQHKEESYGVGIGVLEAKQYIPRKGTKPKMSKLNTPQYDIILRKHSYILSLDSIWIQTKLGKNIELKNMRFIMKPNSELLS